MSTSWSTCRGWAIRILAFVVSFLSVLASSAFTARPAFAAPKTTTTTSPTSTSVAPTPNGGGNGGGGGGVANPKLTAVVSLSRHRVLATYDRDLDAAALTASSYVFYSTQAVNLPVTGVSRATNNQAYVLTGPQEPVTYQVKQPKTARPVTFTGSTTAEPQLVSARPVSTTQIIVSFSEPVGTSALQPSSYQINVQGSTATLAVNGASWFGSTQKDVLLTTAPQQAVPYVVSVINIQGTSGVYVDPTASSLQVSGSTVAPGPMLLSATADGDAKVVLTFDSALDPASATKTANYTSTPTLSISSATLQANNTQVVLSTGPQYGTQYSIVANVTGANGNPVNPAFNSTSFIGGGQPISSDRPTVTGAKSTDNKHVVVQFSKPMADNAVDPSHYTIVQTAQNPEVGTVGIDSAKFAGTDRLSVELTTKSQAEVTYQVTAANVTDLGGNPLADKTNAAGVLVDPTSATFAGTPPEPADWVNSDGDTLWDHEESRGWVVTITMANGDTVQRQVTSSINAADTDGDELNDDVERAIGTDPRDLDTDDDGLSDYSEFNEYFSDPTKQDSDADGLYDGLETGTFFTSPIFDDTDGDQLKDGYEINVNRNPKVADLPKPVLKVGEVNLGLDVRFTETNGQTSRELKGKTVEATLAQSSSQEFSSSESTTHEVSTTLGAKAGVEVGWEIGLFKAESEWTASFEASAEVSNTNSFSSEFTQSSAQATEQEYTNSLSTEEETAKDSSVLREVDGARMSLAVSLESRGNVAFTVKNLQVAALIQDPDDPSRLTPVATLVPETGVDTSFNLGPLVPPKGPIVFSSSEVYPLLVEDLMRNPRGLVFRFANYDILDESGRNFAFTSQDVNDRTARIAIDYGGFDPDGDGRGEETEILRVATGVIGRRVVDTNHDNVVDDNDRKVVFDLSGKQVGLTVRDALEAAGLKWYDEATNPTSSLSPDARRNSFSTLRSPDGKVEIVSRIRDRQMRADKPESWEIVTAHGVDRTLNLDDRILYPGTNITFSFLQDIDKDKLPAVTERTNGCSDTSLDTDGDTLDDRFEVLVGWEIDTPLHKGTVRSLCYSKDSDGDGLTDLQEAPGIIKKDSAGRVLFDDGSGVAPYVAANAPTRDTSGANDPLAGWEISDPITDPMSRDTDRDGLDDLFEITPYQNAAGLPQETTSPENHDTDGDGLSDGIERKLGSDPRVDDHLTYTDSDRDGLADSIEVADDNHNFVIDDAEKAGRGWSVVVTQMHPRNANEAELCENGTCPVQERSAPRQVYSLRDKVDSDGDGLTDYDEYVRKTDPSSADTDGDGLTDFEEVNGFKLPDGTGPVKTDPTNQDTDNDKRSDGEEAGRVGDGIVVRMPGKAPYAANSHPLKADTDMDLLVDGDEVTGADFTTTVTGMTGSTDPANYDTDGDRKSDYSELQAVRNPLLPDLNVEVIFSSLSVTKDGDDGDNPGEVNWSLTAQSTGRAGGPIVGGGVGGGVPIGAGGQTSLNDFTVPIGSVSTSDAVYDEVYINGWIRELDPDDSKSSIDCAVDFPGYALPVGDTAGAIAGTTLKPGLQSWIIHRKVGCSSGQEFEISLNLAVRAT